MYLLQILCHVQVEMLERYRMHAIYNKNIYNDWNVKCDEMKDFVSVNQGSCPMIK